MARQLIEANLKCLHTKDKTKCKRCKRHRFETAIEKYEKPSEYLSSKLMAKKEEIIRDALEWYPTLSIEEVKEIIEKEDVFEELLKLENKHLRIKILKDLIPSFYEATKKKLSTGWTANAKDSMLGMNVAITRVFEDKQIDKMQPINIGGKNVQINVGWKFKAYKDRKN